MEEEDEGTTLQGNWKRKYGYVSEFDIDARWVLYYPNDDRPHGSLRIVSHPDLPPGHLKSFVSIVTKRWNKTNDEVNKTLETYGLMNDNDLYYYNGVFYKTKFIDENDKTIKVSFADPISEEERKQLLRNVFDELDAYTLFEHIETWDVETMDKIRVIEKMYNVKIFE